VKKQYLVGFALVVLFVSSGLRLTQAVVPNAEEFAEVRRWAAAKFDGVQTATKPMSGLFVLANHGPVQLNNRNGMPMRLGKKEFTRGLYCHAMSKIVVRLPGPGKSFSAVVGIDNNADTAVNLGSVVFSASVGGKKAFDSGIVKVETPAKPVEVDLNGASSFTLEAGDGGDGISCDQSDWADAKVELADGRTLWLADLPLLGEKQQAYDTGPLFSCAYGGNPLAKLAGEWRIERSSKKLDAKQTERTVTYTDPKTGLAVCCIGVEFADFPAVEWVVSFRNTGRQDTPILEGIRAFDGLLPLTGAGGATLHWANGAIAWMEDFAPQTTPMPIGATMHLEPKDGRSSGSVLPFFNIERSGGGGAVVALGWTGNWHADFRNEPNGVTLKAGMAHTHLLLHPGESIRSPRMLVLIYRGDRWRGQNLLRQFILAHHRPRLDGKPLVAPITWGNWGCTSAEVHLDNIQKSIDAHLPVDYYWIDAGWYGQGDWGLNVGNWTIDKVLYPQGFKPLGELLHRSGRKLMLWFEPERVHRDTEWYKSHHDWLIDDASVNRDNCLFDLGNPEARKFLTDYISEKIDEYGLDCYRQDFNMDPRDLWQSADAPDRQGMSEIRHIEGLYAFWDDLLARHPRLMIDNCASGGRRIDLETIGRATPLWRTDGPRDPVAHQCHTFGLMAWVPLSATSQDRGGDDYEFRSGISSGLCINWFLAGGNPQVKFIDDFSWEWGKKVLDQYLELRPLYYGDYYPLTPFTVDQTQWVAWQFDCPDKGEGMVQAFRRQDSFYESIRVKLHGLDPNATYLLSDLDQPGTKEMTGRELLDQGLSIVAKNRPQAMIITYKRK
jgi:alpha-galactosidase